MRKITFIKVAFIITLFLLSFAQVPFVYSFSAKEVYENTSKNVVLIAVKCQKKHDSIGSGILISNEGLIITNEHLIIDKGLSKACSNIRVYLRPEKVTGNFETDLVHGYKAKLLDYSADLDLALLKIENPPASLGKIEFADSSEIEIGEEVMAIGHPEQGGLWSLTYGRISGEINNFSNIPGKDVFQTDTSLNRGNSGGPLLDGRGYIVGINSNIARLGKDNLSITGVNFAIKASVAKEWLNKIGYKFAYGEKRPIQNEVPPFLSEGAIENEGAKEKKLKEKVEEKTKSTKVEIKEQEAPYRETPPEEQFQTPVQPYDYDQLLEAVEKDLEDLLEEMREKIRRKND